jgi:transposase
MGSKRRKFSREFKADICALVMSGKRTVVEVSNEHDLSASGVYAWVRQAKADAGQGEPGEPKSSELEELRALRKEVRTLRQERDFLVDAARYFAKAKS